MSTWRLSGWVVVLSQLVDSLMLIRTSEMGLKSPPYAQFSVATSSGIMETKAHKSYQGVEGDVSGKNIVEPFVAKNESPKMT